MSSRSPLPERAGETRPGAGFPCLAAALALVLHLFPGTSFALQPGKDGEPGPIRFRNIAAEVGLDFVLENHPTPRKHLIETMPGGVATFDYDNDGWTDVYFTNGAAIPSLQKDSPKYFNRLYRNEGGRRFQDVTLEASVQGAGFSMGVAAADFDNDGNTDLFVAGAGRNTLFRNTGKGAFEDVTTQAGIQNETWSVAAGWFDFDRDGYLDLLVVNYADWSLAFDRFCGEKERRTYCHPRLFGGLPNTLYRNRGDGTFEDVSERAGIGRHVGKSMSVAFADYDQDGFVDAFVSNDNLPNFLFRNQGDGTFQEVGLLSGCALPDRGRPVASMGVDFRDYDNDGLPDLSVTALAHETFPLFRNRGQGLFVEATRSSGLAELTVVRSGWGNGLVDFDNDGWKDLFTANSHVSDMIEHFEVIKYKEPNRIFLNQGDGAFLDVSDRAGPDFQIARAHRGAAFADFDRDGRMDIVVTALGEPAELWHNVSRNANQWIRLQPVGIASNRDGIGTVIRIGAQTNRMTTSVGYASSSHHGVHFGLGTDQEVDRIEIHWPTGRVQVLERVAAGQVLRITEPES